MKYPVARSCIHLLARSCIHVNPTFTLTLTQTVNVENTVYKGFVHMYIAQNGSHELNGAHIDSA